MNQALIRFRDKIFGRFQGYDELAKNRFHILTENCFNNVTANLVGGSFLTGLLLNLNAGTVQIGLINMLVYTGNIFQILSPLFLERFRKRKTMLIWSRAIIHIMNVVLIGLIAVLPTQDQIKVLLILGMIAALNVVSAFTAQGFSIWHMKSVPEHERASYFSANQISSNVSVYSLLLFGSFLTDLFKQQGMERTGLLVVRAIALLFAMLDIYWLTKVKEYPEEKSGTSINLKNIFLLPLREKRYLPSVLIVFLWSLFANTTGPFYTVYLLSDLKVSYSFINIATSLYVPCVIFLAPIWARHINRTSWFAAFYKALLLYGLVFCTHSLVTADWPWFYIIVAILCFLISPGINIIMANMAFYRLPKTNQTVYLTFYATVAMVGSILGTWFSTVYMSMTEGFALEYLGIRFSNVQLLTLITGSSIILLSVIVYFLHKRDKKITEAEERAVNEQ